MEVAREKAPGQTIVTVSTNAPQDDALQQLQLRVARVLLILFCVGSFSGFFIGLLSDPVFETAAGLENLIFLVSGTVSYIGYRLLPRKSWQPTILSLIPLIPLAVSLRLGWWESLFVMDIFLVLIAAALLCTQRVYYAIIALTVVRLLVHMAAVVQNLPDPRPIVNPLAYLLALIFILSVPFFISVIARYTIITLRQSSFQSNRTVQLLEATAAIGRVMLDLLNLSDLLRRAVDVILAKFSYYHVQIYLLDESRTFAVLAASTGEAGRQLLSRQYRLPLSRQNLISRAAQAGEPVSTSDATDPSRPFDIMPGTRSEIAIPITDGETVIGVLDIQSGLANAFTPLDVQALQVMTSQLATAIRNARLFEAQEKSLRENKRLFLDAETNLREIQRLNRQLTRQTWEEYLTVNRAVSGVTLDHDSFHPGADWTDRMMQAGLRRRPMTKREDDRAFIAVPVELRGEVIGAMEVEIPNDLHSEGIIDMMQAIADRLAISLDNARLFEETQEATAQEQRINEIVSQYQSASTVDDLLQVTLEGLFETLGAESASIRLGKVGSSTNETPVTQSQGMETRLS